MKTIALSAFAGVRNDISPERGTLNDLFGGVNIDIDDTGKLWRRQGTTRILSGPMHSLYSNGDISLLARGPMLIQLHDDFTETLLATVSGDKIAYKTIGNKVYWSDGVTSGVVFDGMNHPWGIVPPAGVSIGVSSGNLLAGTYLTTAVYVREDGTESGASAVIATTVGDNSALDVAIPDSLDPLVTMKRLYVSAVNGEVCYLFGHVSNSSATLTVSESVLIGPKVRTSFMGPPPAGKVLGLFAGRAYVAQGQYLWYSAPFEYELFDMRAGYIGFNSTVTTFAPVSDGLFIGSDRAVYFLAGTDPTQFHQKQVAAYGAVHGTERELPGYYAGAKGGVPGVVQTFMTTHGMCAGYEHGEFKNLTGDRYIPVPTSTGASLLKVRGGTPLLTTSLFKE